MSSAKPDPSIRRLPGFAPSRSRAVAHGGFVHLFAVSPAPHPSLYDQTKAALAAAEKTLAEMGSSKERILSVTVYITDMTRKDDMNRAWDEWADPAHAPMRVCVGAALTGAALVEMMIVAAA